VGDAMAPVVTTHGGFVELLVELKEDVEAGQKVAIQRNTFGEVVAEYTAPRGGQVIARRTDATCEAGMIILSFLFDSATPEGGDIVVE
jgi:predicted deacylase